MLTDPQSVTVNTVAKSMPAVNRGNYASTYRESGGEHTLSVASTFGKRDRSVVKLTAAKEATDPFTALTVDVSSSVYLVMDRPKFGYSEAEVDYLVQALATWLSSANTLAVLGGES